MDYYAGIDVSLELSSVCILDASGQIVREAKVASEPEALATFLASLNLPLTRVGLEAGPLFSAPFRQGLSALGLSWAVGIPRIQKVYPADVQLVLPPVTRGGPRKTLVPDEDSIAAEALLAKTSWQRITWRRGTKGPLRARFAAVRVRVADGPEVRLQGRTGQHLPGDEVWLVGEHRSSGERKYYLSNLPPDTPLKRLAALIKARWVCEPAHQQLKEELGLDHFEGRSWRGLHRHALLTLIAYLFLPHLRLRAAKGEKESGLRHNRPCQPSGAGYLTIWPTPCACDVQSAGLASLWVL